MVAPPQAVVDAVLAASTKLIRRIEIYERDGLTRFAAGAHDVRLIDGTVSVDYNRDERRTLELVLDNSDFGLENSPAGIWYDKVIKVFHGVEIAAGAPTTTVYVPKVVIIENIFTTGTDQEALFRSTLVAAGYTDITTNTAITTLAGLAGYDIVVSLCNQFDSAKGPLLQEAFNAGYSVFTTGNDTSAVDFPEMIKTTSLVAAQGSPTNTWTMAPNPDIGVNPLTTGWSAYTGFSTDTDGRYITAIPFGVIPVSKTTQTTANGSEIVYNIIAAQSGRGGAWVHMQDFYLTPTQAQNFVKVAMAYLEPIVTQGESYTGQIGEFDVTRISESHFPYTIRVQGIDFTKRCQLSKFVESTTILVGNKPQDAIGSIATNAGITKFLFDYTASGVSKDFSYERGTERWSAMKEIAEAYNYEIFFNAQGYLVLRKFIDPVTSPVSTILKTDANDAGLVSYEKSTNDSRIFNSIAVTGEAADIIPVFASAKNTVSTSPTRIAKLGERVLPISNPLITTTAQAQELANQYLKVSALEEYELNFQNIALSWLEAGEILQFNDPRPAAGDPNKFLIIALEFSLGLGPMTGTAKRVVSL